MEKIITFTLDNGAGEQDLTDCNMRNIAHELEAKAEDYFKNVSDEDEDFFEVTIRVEKKYTQEEVENLPDYTG
jgi:hypothetical protein